MLIVKAEFIKSSKSIADCPEAVFPEYSFIGRSNVGKSSLINMITGRKKLAKISATPGKTQLINHFLINESWYLVDLPGIGYARVSKTTRNSWERSIFTYLTRRKNLLRTFFLVDSRHNPMQNDISFINWMGESRLPFTILFTKTDKLSKIRLRNALDRYSDYLQNYWEELPPMIITSSMTGLGKEEILSAVQESNKIFRNTED